jgi:membrane-associated phospholipid phosphatase
MAMTFALAAGSPAAAQDTAHQLPSFIWHDQVRFVTSPAHAKRQDLAWIAPLVGVAGFLLATDQRNMSERIHSNPSMVGRSQTFSNVGLGTLAGIPAFLLWQGWRNRGTYEEKTGWLAARAVADTLVTSEGISLLTRRQRPTTSGSADFFSNGAGASAFPSQHAAVAWALASVVAHRYPGWLSNVLAYGLATGVTASRVIGREHSPSDVFVGSALGYWIGKYVAGNDGYRPPWKPLHASSADRTTAGPSPSTYVPMDSWIYSALDRLAALGYVPSQIAGLRPWTRSECLRQTREAAARLSPEALSGISEEAAGLVSALQNEFANDSDAPGIVLQSVYARNGIIAGPPLNNSFHFGQTWINDNGRPFGRGWNSDDGFVLSARAGRFFAYVDGEMQHAPGTPPLSLPVRQTIAEMDDNPVQPAQPSVDTNRFRTTEAYLGISVGGIEISVGKQSLYWGPSYDAPLSFSTNGESTKNLKISTAHPFDLGVFGKLRAEFVMGKLGGQIYTWRPWFNGVKLSLKLTKDLEVGFTRWSILWGVGHPITVGSFVRNFTSTNSPTGTSGLGALDPGDRKGGFDFRYRIPGLTNWLTLYSDSYSDDDPSPLANPRRAAINPGLYLSHVPGLPQLDLRVEAPSTKPFDGSWDIKNLNYFNDEYHSANTNYGTLIGNSVGRDGRAVEVWSDYHFSPRVKLELGFRDLKGSAKLLPGGSSQSDASLKLSLKLGGRWYADCFAQYERYSIPLLGPRQRDVSGWLQLTWEPEIQILGKGSTVN